MSTIFLTSAVMHRDRTFRNEAGESSQDNVTLGYAAPASCCTCAPSATLGSTLVKVVRSLIVQFESVVMFT
jgi:hypothetical protein